MKKKQLRGVGEQVRRHLARHELGFSPSITGKEEREYENHAVTQMKRWGFIVPEDSDDTNGDVEDDLVE